jgi:hypothetical protein
VLEATHYTVVHCTDVVAQFEPPPRHFILGALVDRVRWLEAISIIGASLNIYSDT